MHNDKDIINLSKLLAKEALILDSLCRSDSADEKIKEYQLSQVAALARRVTGDTGDYNPADDVVYIR